MKPLIRSALVILGLAASGDVGITQAHGVALPPGFLLTEVASGLSQTIAMAFSPDGRLFVCEKGGRLRVIKNSVLLATPFLTLDVAPLGPSASNGLLGVAFHPQFQTNGFFYVHYTAKATETRPAHNRISRFHATGDVADPDSEVVLLELHDESTTGHYGGDMHFGPDGLLYIAIGQYDSPSSAQLLTDFKGKILRINPDGTIPPENPFSGETTEAGRLTWTLGLRNPFTFAFDRVSGRMFINDVGEQTYEEINAGSAGANFGWPAFEGPASDPRYRDPFYFYGRDDGCALTAGAFYDPAVPRFPAQYVGKYFFADWCSGWIRTVDPSDPSTVTTFATGTHLPMDFEVGPGGGLYYIEWQNDKVYRITYGNWSSGDVGAVGAPGSVTTDGTTFTVRGSGADIWGTADEFFYTSTSVTGDFEFSARVASVQNLNQWTKAGLMMRTATTPGAVHASVFATPTTVKGVAFQRRPTSGGTSVHTSGPAVAPPLWLRLIRTGSTVTAYSRSTSSAPWTTIGAQTFASLPAAVRIGFAVSSHVDGQLATAVFDDVNIVQRDPATNLPPTVSLTAPADGATFPAPAIVEMRANASDPDDGVSRVEFQLESASGWSTIDEDPTAPYEGQAQLNSPGTYRLRARAVDASGAATVSNAVSVTVITDSAAWQSSDIGAVGAPGSATVGDTTATVTGSGSDIWGTADELHFAHRTMSGDFEITARVASVENVNAWTKAGLMIREHLGAGARHASLLATPTTAKGVAFQRRPTAGGTTVHTSGPAQAPAEWLKLTRRGDRITAYYRKLRTDFWTVVGEQVLVGLPGVVDVGLAVSSHVDGVGATATFTDLRVAPLPQWTATTIGAGGGSATHDSAMFTVAGRGADIWGAADAFHALLTTMSGDGSITARVKSIQQTHEWSKAGVMIRETTAAGSKHAFALVSAARGMALQYRAATNGATASAGSRAGVAPAWVRLQRSGNTFTASTSVDGATWTPIGTATIAMAADISVGLAVTSHDTAAAANAQFDDVVVEP